MIRIPFIFVALLLLTASMSLQAGPAPEPVNGIAAKVNKEIITYRQVQEILFPLLRRMPPEEADRQAPRLQKEIIDQLVAHELILHDYKTEGYILPESVVEEQIQRRIREQYGDRKTLAKTLRAQGDTYEKFRERERENIIVQQMRHVNVSSDIIVSPKKIREYFESNEDEFQLEERVKLRMIVVNQPEGAPADRAAKMAREILIKLNDGAAFEEMARVYSEGAHAQNGGDWGWVEKSVLRKDLAEQAFTLEKGKHSGVIGAANAAFIMKVEDREGKGVRPLTEVSEQIENTLLSQEQNRLYNLYIERLKRRQYVAYF
jgi:peptidyl-prolyl cis-trans isomerase SurA